MVAVRAGAVVALSAKVIVPFITMFHSPVARLPFHRSDYDYGGLEEILHLRHEWHGETLFYARDEAVSAVTPLPGRLALFPTDIFHRSGMPSRLCLATRLTVAFKFTTDGPPEQEQP